MPAPAVLASTPGTKPPADPPPVLRWFERPGTALLLVLLAVALRRPDTLFHPQFEAEDGPVFFGQNYNFGWHAILRPYSGYLHLIPRLVAFLAGTLPLAVQPAAYAYFSLSLLLAVTARLFRPGIRLPHKLWFALAIVLMVRGTGESFGNLASVHWFLALVPLLMFLEGDPAQLRGRAAWDVGILALIGLSSPIVALCTPLFALRLAWNRSRWSLLCLGVAAATGAVQGIFHHRQPVDPNVLPTAGQWAVFLGSKWVGVLLFGNELSQTWVPSFLALGLLAGFAALLISLVRRNPALRKPAIGFALFGALMILGGALRFVKTIDLCLPILQEDRYLYLPRLMLVWSLLLFVDTARGWQRMALGGALALSALSAAVDLRCPARPDRQWARQVANVRPGQWAWLQCNPHWNIYLNGSTMADDLPTPGNAPPDPTRWHDVLGAAPILVKPAGSAHHTQVNGQPFLQIDAPGCLIFDIPAQSRAISGRCALPPVPAPGVVVEFRLVLLSNSLPPALLWSRRFDPGVPRDRLPVRFQGALPFNDTGQILLSVRSVPAAGAPPASAVSTACWADIAFR